MNLAEVEVNTKTGKTRVIRFTVVDEVGKVGNIDAVNGQTYGGISHSIGFALTENITVIHLENADPDGPFGSSGASEAFQAAWHVAVLNAINNACGVRIYEMPATKEKVKAGLEVIAKGGKVQPPKKYFLGSDLYDELENIKANPVKFKK